MSAASASYFAATSAALAFIFLIFATPSPWTLYNVIFVSSANNNIGTSVAYGIGPFIAGAQQSSTFFANSLYYYGGLVWWNQLNTANTCQSPSESMQQWAQNNGMCNDDNKFVIPSEAQGIQACVVLATIFSFFACCAGFSVSRSKSSGGSSAACTSLLAMVFTIAAFAIWTTWPLSKKYQSSPGEYLPVWVAPTATNPQFTVGLTPGRVVLYFGWTYITTVCSFVLLLFSTVTFAAVAKRLADEDSDPYGTGGMRAI